MYSSSDAFAPPGNLTGGITIDPIDGWCVCCGGDVIGEIKGEVMGDPLSIGGLAVALAVACLAVCCLLLAAIVD